MIINAANIPKYFHSLTFPMELRDSESRILRHINREEFIVLVKESMVVGVGTWKRMRHVVFCPLNPECRRKTRPCDKVLPIAEDNRTVRREVIAGYVLYQHHPMRSLAYAVSSPRHSQ